jgi:hypothetical protein
VTVSKTLQDGKLWSLPGRNKRFEYSLQLQEQRGLEVQMCKSARERGTRSGGSLLTIQAANCPNCLATKAL